MNRGPIRTILGGFLPQKLPLPPADGDQPAHGRTDNPYVVRTVDAALLLHFILPVFQQPGIELWKSWSGVIEL